MSIRLSHLEQKAVFALGLMAIGLAACGGNTFQADQFDVSHVVRGKGTVTVANATLERHLVSVVRKHFFGLRTPAPFAVEIPIGGNARTFEASCGIDRADPPGRARLSVLGDGKTLWTSPVLSSFDTNEVSVAIEVGGVKTLTLCADAVEGDRWTPGVIWGEAKLMADEGTLLPNDTRRTSRQLGILTPPVRFEPRVNGPRVYGVRPGRPILYRVPVTGEAPLTIAVKGLDDPRLRELTYDAATRILSGRIAVRGTYALTISATNARGTDEKPFVIKVGDTLSLTPVLGWSSWNAFAGAVSQEKVRKAADALIASGLADHGYAYINIDDFWQNNPEYAIKDKDPLLDGPLRDVDGFIAPNRRFPDMKGLVDHIHAKGLKAGIYSSPGPFTCGRAAGSWQHEAQDAKRFADWGFDYLKHDWCFYDDVAFGTGRERAMRPYRVMGRLLAEQERDIVFSLCQYGAENVSAWGREVGAQSWRTTGDVFDTWASVSAAIEKQKRLFSYTGPGAWNDPDMLCVGCVAWNEGRPCRLAPNEQYTQISLWALVAAPLLIGCDLEKLDAFTHALLTNDEVIDIDQDPLGKGAACIAKGEDWEIWARPLADGSVAAGLYNQSNREQPITFDLAEAGLLCKWRVRDVWRQEDVGVFAGQYEATVPGHATHLIRLTPCRCGKFREGMTDIRENTYSLIL